MALITCKNAAFGYDGNAVVSGLNFAVENGDYLCIVGENGAGKSTLIKGLLRLLPPMAGQLEASDNLLANDIGYLPQQTAAQKDFPASVWEVVLSGRLNKKGLRPFYSRNDKEQARQNMERLGIAPLKEHCYRELSGGQQQRVLLARALCATSRLLLLDEPMAGIDPIATAELYQLIQMLNQQTNITVLMVSHDVQNAVENASHILHLQKSQKYYGLAADYVNTAIGKTFLGK